MLNLNINIYLKQSLNFIGTILILSTKLVVWRKKFDLREKEIKSSTRKARLGIRTSKKNVISQIHNTIFQMILLLDNLNILLFSNVLYVILVKWH